MNGAQVLLRRLPSAILRFSKSKVFFFGTLVEDTQATNTHQNSSHSMVIHVDGSRGEGGGQILRNAISFATILQKNLVVDKIRAKRSKPGLREQHAVGLRLAAEVCGGSLSGSYVGSTEIRYEAKVDPETNQESINKTGKGRRLRGEVSTAGSICLLLQAALPCALFNRSRETLNFTLKGGTNATMAPQYDYWEQVFIPTLVRCDVLATDQVQAEVIRRGFFPKGGGEVRVMVKPLQKSVPPILITERGEVVRVSIRSFHAGKLPRRLAEEMAKVAKEKLLEHFAELQLSLPPVAVNIVFEAKAMGSGLGILIVAETSTGCLLAGSAISSPKKNAKETGEEAADELLSTLSEKGCVDEWLQDQLVLFMALADGASEIITGSLTLHTQTAIWVAEKLTNAKFEVTNVHDTGNAQGIEEKETTLIDGYGQDGRIAGRHRIRCKGIGLLSQK